MASRTYERLSIELFGDHLLQSNDLDPVYVALKRCEWDDDVLANWLVAYWCYYDCGVASYLCTMFYDDFWEALDVAAKNESMTPINTRWKRGSERRHARGQAARTMVAKLRERYETPSAMITSLRRHEPHTCASVMKWTKRHHLFGDWIGFKVADMADRVLGIPVDFDQAAVFMFKDPVKAALMLWRERQGLPENARPRDQQRVISEVVEHLTLYYSNTLAPPLDDRPVGLQEVETILCKWKSHMNGHYPLNNDINEIRHSVEPWTVHSDAAAEFLEAMPQPLHA